MVHADMQHSKIAGGFVAIPVARLIEAWRACGSRPLARNDFRTWLALHEMVARRPDSTQARIPEFSTTELARLLGGLSQRRVKASLRRLADARIIVFSPNRIEFLNDDALDQPLDVIGGGRGAVFVPRRILRHLAASGSPPALIATAMAVLLRCLSRRRTGFDGRGRFKASWVAEIFAIDLRRVKAARAELIGLGWIEPEPSDQKAENRWGRVFRINLRWERFQGAPLPPLTVVPQADFATPSVDPDPLREENQNQEPAPPAGSGFRIKASKGEKLKVPTNPTARELKPTGQAPVTADLPSPRLDDVRPEDLGSVERLLELHGQAINRGLLGPSEADRLKFVALAEHALRMGKSNPPGLFAALLQRGAWAYITQGEEDAARRKLKAHLWGSSPGLITLPPRQEKVSALISDDVRIVREISRSLAEAGYRGDPFPQFRRIDPSWTRARWDAASSACGLTRNGPG